MQGVCVCAWIGGGTVMEWGGGVHACICVCVYICVGAVTRDAGTAGVWIPPWERTGPCLSLCPGTTTGCSHVWMPMGPLSLPTGPWGPFADRALVVHMGYEHGTKTWHKGRRTRGMVCRRRQRGSARWGEAGACCLSASPPNFIPPCPGAEGFLHLKKARFSPR